MSGVEPEVVERELWAIVEYQWGDHEYAQVYSRTPKTVEAKVGAGRRLSRVPIRQIIAWHHDKHVIDKMIVRLVSARAECRRRENAARVWLTAEKAKIVADAQPGSPLSVSGRRDEEGS